MKKHHQRILKYLIGKGIKPIPLNLMQSTIKTQKAGDTLFNSVYATFNNAEGQRKRIQGMGISFVKSIDEQASTFVMEKAFKEGGNGSAVISNGKVVGMMTHKDGLLSDGVVLKSTYIIAALRKLQRKELALKLNTK